MAVRTGAIVGLAFLSLSGRSALAAGPLRLSPPPAGAGATSPQLASAHDGAWLSWLEPGAAKGKTLRVAHWAGGRWSAPSTVVEGADLLANWADVPGLAESADGALYAQWLEEYRGGYGVELARSNDLGKTWSRLGPLHADRSASEHGFVSFAPTASGLLAFWLDGRSTPQGGATELRMRVLGGPATPAPTESVIDDRVCDCCQTAAAASGDGALIAYRDRSREEVRDIALVRIAGGKVSAPVTVHADAWKILGCPVNGPAIAAAGLTVVVAWFTGSNGRPRVEAARSTDGGATFGPPWSIDDAAPLGRVGLALGPDGEAAISWLAKPRPGDRGDLRVRRFDAGGHGGPPMKVADLAAGRAGGTPRMVRSGDRLLFVWVDRGSIAAATLGWSDLPRP